MKFAQSVARLGIASLTIAFSAVTQAKASVVFEYTGVLGDNGVSGGLFEGYGVQGNPLFLNGEFSFRIDLPDPNFRLGSPLNEIPVTVPLPPNQQYYLAVRFDGAPISAQAVTNHPFWSEWYDSSPNGTFYINGGADTIGVVGPTYLPTTVLGNTVFTSLNDIYNYEVGAGEGTAFDTRFEWYDAFGINAELSPDLEGAHYTILLSTNFISAIPEPATWAIMLLGFGGMGVILRRRKLVVA